MGPDFLYGQSENNPYGALVELGAWKDTYYERRKDNEGMANWKKLSEDDLAKKLDLAQRHAKEVVIEKIKLAKKDVHSDDYIRLLHWYNNR